jgi:hypothetical protein
MRAPFAQVYDARREPLRMQGKAQHIDGRLQQRRVGAREQRHHGAIMRHQRPVTVDRERRIGLVAGQHQVDRLARRLQRRIVEGALGKDRRIAGRDQQHIALAQRHLEPLREIEHHVARGLGAAGLQEAEMLGGNLGLHRKRELTQAPALPPVAQMVADGPDILDHAGTIAARVRQLHYLTGNLFFPANAPPLPRS